jgi:signal transduction histidine kinase
MQAWRRLGGRILDARLLGGMVLAICALQLLAQGWLGIERVDQLVGGVDLPKVNSALSLGAVGAAMWLLGAHAALWRRVAAYALAGIAIAVGVGTLAEYGLDRDLGLDQWLIALPPHADPLSARPALMTALALVLLGAAVFGLERQVGDWHVADGLALAAMLVTAVSFIGRVFGESSDDAGAAVMPVVVSVLSLLLAAGLMCARPRLGLAGDVLRATAAAPLTRRVAIAGIAIAATMLLGATWMEWRTAQRASETAEWVALSHDVEADLHELLSLMQDASAQENGFLKTGDPAFLHALEARIADVKALQAQLLLEIRDPAQHEKMLALEPLIAQRLSIILRNVQTRRTQGEVTLDMLIATLREGSQPTANVRAHIDAMVQGQARLLESRLGVAQRESTNVSIATLSVTVLSLSLLGALFFMLFREIRSHLRTNALLTQREVQLVDDLKVRTALQKELTDANRELTEFAYIVSHDLKAPLRGIASLATRLEDDQGERLDDGGREHLRLMKSRVTRLSAMIEGILSYSRAGRSMDARAQVDLAQVVPEVIELLAPPAHIAVSVDSPMPRVHMDPTKARQLFQNLLSNAIKYMDKPQGEVRVTCTEDEDAWRFAVADNGPGIEARYFERIFQLFETLAPRDRVEGTGVGLALVKKIVELEGGRIWVESVPGAGATFRFTLPKG